MSNRATCRGWRLVREDILARIVAPALLAQAAPAWGVTLDDGGSHVIDSAYISVLVYDGPTDTPTTVTLETGAYVAQRVVAWDNSIVNLEGGVVAGSVEAEDNSLVTLAGAFAGQATASGTSELRVERGAVAGLLATGSALSLISGGESCLVRSQQSAEVSVTGGTVGGGSVSGALASLVLAGGQHGATCGSGTLEVFGNGLLEVSGGEFAGEFVVRDGTLEISGALLQAELLFEDDSAIDIYGPAFELDGTPVGFGPIQADAGTLTGTLQDGAPLDLPFSCESPSCTGGEITLIQAPEPEAAIQAIVGLAVLARLAAAGRSRGRSTCS